MAKKILIGPAGSGKTTKLLDEFYQTLTNGPMPLSRSSFFLLPSAEHVDRVTTLLFQRGLPGFFHHRVTTLSRLIGEVFGLGDEKVASNVTRRVILREILDAHAWPYFEEVRDMPGFVDLAAAFLSEMKESLVSVSFFRERMNALKSKDPDFAFKYESLAGIYEAYETGLQKRGLRDRQDDLALFREQKKQGCGVPHFEKIWLDGFFDFSGLQFEYLKELSEMCGDITVSLTYDPAAGRADLFEPLRETTDALVKLGFEAVFQKVPNKRAAKPSLVYLEQHLFEENLPKGKPPSPEGIEFYEAVGIQGEIEMIAREILRVTRAGGCRFSDFAILLRQVSGYEPVIRSVFSRYEIPVEIHEREKLKLSPLIQTVAHLLRIFKNGWEREDIMNFFKSSYVKRLGPDLPKNYEDASELENRAYASGILKDRENWLRVWPSGDEAFHEKKLKWLAALVSTEDALRQAGDFSKMRKILAQALTKTFGVFEFKDSIEESVRRDAASWKRFESLCVEVQNQMENAEFACDFGMFAEHFLKLVDVDLYSLHDRNRNRVQIYSVSLARQKEYRVVFVAGLLEKNFPARVKEDPLLSDWERRLFNAETPSLRERLPRQNMERYLFYLAATRASERLILTCPRLDLEGKEALPSFYLDEVRVLFEKPPVPKKQDLSHPYPSVEDAISRRELETALAGELWHIDPVLKEDKGLLLCLFNDVLKEEGSRARFRQAFREIRAEIMDPAILAMDAFRTAAPSATRLEDYAKCPYKYFAGRMLKLKDPREKINIKLKGIIRHEVLENYFRHVGEEGALGLEASRKWILKEIEKSLRERPLVAEKKYQLELDEEEIRDMLLRFISAELERLNESKLKPAHFEFSFGTQGEPDAPALEIDDNGIKIRLAGQIDRIDINAELSLGMIIDYKTGARLSRGDIDFGVSLQLPLYVRAMERFLKVKPAGAQLFSLKDGKITGFYHGENAAALPEISKRSLMDKAEFEELLDKSFNYIRRFVRDMKQGKIPVRPRSCEEYCPYPSVCRIQKWRLPLIVKEIQEEDAEIEARKPAGAGAKK